METTIAITLSCHEKHEGFNTPETLLFERTSRENSAEFTLRIFRSIIRHHYSKLTLSDGWDDITLFVSMHANIAHWELGMYRKELKSFFDTTRVPLLYEQIN